MPLARKLPLVISSRIKTAIARATFKPGAGKVVVNSMPLDVWGTKLQRQLASIPLNLVPDKFKEVDVYVKVSGGGWVAQARAVMTALARGIWRWTRSVTVKKELTSYDPYIISGDPRMKEPKKFGGRGARKRFQKSYR